MNKARILLLASVVAGAMVFGGVMGATVLARSTFTSASAAQSTASPSPSFKSNETAAHEARESAAHEAAENNGSLHPAGPGGGMSNETAAHEARETAAHEAAEKS